MTLPDALRGVVFFDLLQPDLFGDIGVRRCLVLPNRRFSKPTRTVGSRPFSYARVDTPIAQVDAKIRLLGVSP